MNLKAYLYIVNFTRVTDMKVNLNSQRDNKT